MIGEIKRYIRDDGPIKISRSIKELAIKINELRKEYFDEKGVEITIEEIEKKLNVDRDNIVLALETVNSVESLENSTYTNQNDGNQINLIDTISNNKNEEEQVINKIVIKELVNKLNKRDKEVIMLRFYKEKTQSEVSKILGVTQVQVSRIERKILENMRKDLREAT